MDLDFKTALNVARLASMSTGVGVGANLLLELASKATDAENAVNSLMESLAKIPTDDDDRYCQGKGGKGAKGGKGDWIHALVQAMGEMADKQAAELSSLKDQVGNGSKPSAVLNFQEAAERFKLLMSTFTNVINSVLQSLDQTARPK